MEISTSRMPLYLRYYSTYQLLRNTDDKHEKIALENYIGNLYSEMMMLSHSRFQPEYQKIFGSKKNYCLFQNQMRDYDQKMLKQYIKNQEYHCNFFEEIIEKVEDILQDIEGMDVERDVTLSREEFEKVFVSFMKYLNLEEFYNEFCNNENNHIHSIEEMEDGDSYNGFITFNPVNQQTDIYVVNYGYNIETLFVLAHEFGHAYDFSMFDGNVKEYNRFFFESFCSEVFSKLFERLFLQFLIDSNTYVDVAKMKLAKMMIENYDFFLSSYMISLLEPDYLKKLESDSLEPLEVYQLVKEYFDDEIIEFVDDMEELSIAEENSYAYGDIISMFLKEDVLENHFDGKMMKDFLGVRSKKFQKSFMKRYDINPDTYLSLYEKDHVLIKK